MLNYGNCYYNLTSPSDTFSSYDNNGGNRLPPYTDCRWVITVDKSNRVRLTFVFFDTAEDLELVSVC